MFRYYVTIHRRDAANVESLTPPKHFVFPFRNLKGVLSELDALLDRENPVYRITGFPIKVYVSKEPEFAEAVFGHKKVGMTKLPAIMPRIEKVMKKKGGFIMAGGDEWRRQRSISQQAFRPQFFDDFLRPLPGITTPFFERWDSVTGPFDIFRDLRDIFCDLNFQMLFRYKLDAAQLRAVEQATLFLDLEFVNPMPLAVPTPSNLKFRRSMKVVFRAFEDAIIARQSDELSMPASDLLGVLLQNDIEHDRVLGEMGSVYFGASILSTTLAWALFLIGSNSAVEEKLAAEASRFDLANENLREKLNQFPYALAVTKETLRLYPSSWGFPRYTDEEMTILGRRIEKDSLLIPLILLTQRDPRFWIRAEEFRPERFINKGEDVGRYTYLPFSMGPRTCMGGSLAMVILPTLLLMISKRFRIEFRPRFEGDPIAEFGFEIHPYDAVKMRFSRR